MKQAFTFSNDKVVKDIFVDKKPYLVNLKLDHTLYSVNAIVSTNKNQQCINTLDFLGN